MCRHLVGSLFGFYILVVCSNSYAQSVLPEVSVVDSAAHRRTLLSASAPVYLLSQTEMTQLGLGEVAEALRQVGGVKVKDYGGLGGMKTVSVRNLGAEHTGVIYDGVPVSNCQAGKIDIARFSTDNMSSIRMGIGSPIDLLTPASVEPFSGCLYLSTASGHSTPTAKLSYGNWNTLSSSAMFSHGPLDASAHYSHTDGNYPFTLTNGNTQTRERRTNGRVDAINAEINAKGEWGQDSNHPSHLSAKFYYYYSDRGLPGGIVYYNNESHEHLWDENCFAQARYHTRLGTRWEAQLLVKYNHAWNKYFDGNQVDDGGIAMHTYRYRQDETYLSAGASYRTWGNRLQLALVVDELWNSLRTNIPETRYRHRSTTYSTLRASLHAGRLTANASLTYTFLDESTTRQRLTPNISLSLQPWENRELYVRASWRQAFRLPTFNDLYYYRLGNHNLRPETTHEINLGLTCSTSFLGGRLSLSADGYANRVHDLIVAFPTTFAWKMYNYGKVNIWGLNLMSSYQHKRVTATIGYDLNDATSRSSNITGNYSRQVPYTALHSGYASLVCHTSLADIGYALQWMGERYSSLMHERQYRLGSYDDHSLTLSRSFQIAQHGNIGLSLTCKNLFDRQYDIIQFYPMPGRSFVLNINYEIK